MDATTELMTPEEASAFLNLPVKNLQYRRHAKQPPVYLKFGHLVRYRKSDLEKYLDSCVVDHSRNTEQ